MPKQKSLTGSELFIVDNSNTDWKVHKYLHDWCPLGEEVMSRSRGNSKGNKVM